MTIKPITEDEIKLVKSLWYIWQLLTEKEKALCIKDTESVSYNTSKYIFKEGSIPEHIYFLKSGQLRMSRQGISGKLHITRLIRPGQIFGFRSYMMSNVEMSTVKTFSPVVVYRIKGLTFLDILRNNIKVSNFMVNVVIREMNLAENRTIFLTQKYTRGRLADTILLLHDYYGFKKGEGEERILDVSISRQDLADLSNMTSSNCIRTLSEFVKEGILALSYKTIEIVDFEALRNVSEVG